MSTAESMFIDAGQTVDGAVKSAMFGKSCFKLDGKAFTCFFNDCMVFKLTGIHHTNALALEDSILFDPSGKNRPMKQWVQVSLNHCHTWPQFAKAAALGNQD